MDDRNRVLIGLPDRLNKAQEALREIEQDLVRLRKLSVELSTQLEVIKLAVAGRKLTGDKSVVDQVSRILEMPGTGISPTIEVD